MAVAGLEFFQTSFDLPQKVGLGPHGANIEAGGVVGRPHRGKAAIDDELGRVLRFVDNQEGVSRSALGLGLGMGTEEGTRGLAQDATSGFRGNSPASFGPAVGQALFEPQGADGDLGGSWVNVDDIAAAALQEGHQIDLQVGDSFILAALAGEDPQKFAAALLQARVNHGPDRLQLVRPQRNFNNQLRKQFLGSQHIIEIGLQVGRGGHWSFVLGHWLLTSPALSSGSGDPGPD